MDFSEIPKFIISIQGEGENGHWNQDSRKFSEAKISGPKPTLLFSLKNIQSWARPEKLTAVGPGQGR